MAHGTPDWGVTSGAKTVFQLTDLAEHAVRLGSIDLFDRGGDVVFLDGFEDGLNPWVAVTNGTGAAVAIVTTPVRDGAQAVRLTGGSDGVRVASVRKDLAAPELLTLGAEMAFHLDGQIESLEIDLDVFDGANLTRFNVRWLDSADALQYRDSNDVWVTFASGLSLSTTGNLFHILKLVADASLGEYVRVRLNNRVYTLEGVPARISASAALPRFLVEIRLISLLGQNNRAVIDNVIVTQNEPV